mmetsp:Transcript_37341/g.78195  ORF Transcript_37341/g.78195 Transcript_37341/m.78195 type:complete len:220 (-) Transcript_37341:69-728(-)
MRRNVPQKPQKAVPTARKATPELPSRAVFRPTRIDCLSRVVLMTLLINLGIWMREKAKDPRERTRLKRNAPASLAPSIRSTRCLRVNVTTRIMKKKKPIAKIHRTHDNARAKHPFSTLVHNLDTRLVQSSNTLFVVIFDCFTVRYNRPIIIKNPLHPIPTDAITPALKTLQGYVSPAYGLEGEHSPNISTWYGLPIPIPKPMLELFTFISKQPHGPMQA